MNTSDHARQRFRPPGASWNQEGAFYGQEGSPLHNNVFCRGDACDHARQRFRPPGASWNQEGAFYGDAFSENVMVHESKYSALIDWGWSGWHLLEHEFAMLASGAFESGLARHAPQLDLPLLGAIRLNIGLEVASYGLIDWSIVRQGLREALEYGS